MQYLSILFLLLIPALTGANEHRIASATHGNKLILSVQNSLAVDLKNVKITVQSAPSWLVFGQHEYNIDTIPGLSQADALFEFSVLDVEAGRTESVDFVISNEHGAILGKRVLESGLEHYFRDKLG